MPLPNRHRTSRRSPRSHATGASERVASDAAIMHDDPDDEDWYDDNADSDVVPCPECGESMYDDADQCPACGHWLTEADRRALGTGTGVSRGVRWVAIVMIIIFLVTLLLTGVML